MMVRFLVASVLMGMLGLGNRKKAEQVTERTGAIKAGILMGIALFMGFSLQTIGLQYTTPSKNAFLTALNVVIVPFIAFLILKKKIGIKGIVGAILSVVGVALLSLNGNHFRSSCGWCKTELLTELIHDLQIGLRNGHLWNLLPVA